MILLRIVLLIRCLRFLSTKEELDVVLLINMEYVCNNNVVIDKNVILNIENICYDKFKEKWYNDLMLNDHSKLSMYRYIDCLKMNIIKKIIS